MPRAGVTLSRRRSGRLSYGPAEFRRAYLLPVWPDVAKPGGECGYGRGRVVGGGPAPRGAAVSGEVASGRRSVDTGSTRRDQHRGRSGRRTARGCVVTGSGMPSPRRGGARLVGLSVTHIRWRSLVKPESRAVTRFKPLAEAGSLVTLLTAHDVGCNVQSQLPPD